ncbi:MAG: autoinducer binding domain-containing protein [Pseudomonadota bacterium]
MDSSILERLARFGASKTNTELWDECALALADYGFTYAKYGLVTASPKAPRLADIVLFGQFSDEWESYNRTIDWPSEDYVVQHLISRSVPLQFGELYSKLRGSELTDAQKRNHSVSLDLGMFHGIAIPCRTRNPFALGGTSLVADSAFNDATFAKHIENIFPHLEILVEAFHSLLHRPSLLPENRQLSARERECLIWLASGRRLDAVADKMGTQIKTVEKQLANARRKLAARTTNQAIARAIALELLEL